jgi:hypothetical protein
MYQVGADVVGHVGDEVDDVRDGGCHRFDAL